MPDDAWICLNKQDSEYTSGPTYAEIVKYAKILDVVGVSIYKCYTTFWICWYMPWWSSECISGFKYARILNMAGFWICKSYAGF